MRSASTATTFNSENPWLCRGCGSSRYRGRSSKGGVGTRPNHSSRHVHVKSPSSRPSAQLRRKKEGGDSYRYRLQALAPRWARATQSKRADRAAHDNHPSLTAALSRRRGYPQARGEQCAKYLHPREIFHHMELKHEGTPRLLY